MIELNNGNEMKRKVVLMREATQLIHLINIVYILLQLFFSYVKTQNLILSLFLYNGDSTCGQISDLRNG